MLRSNLVALALSIACSSPAVAQDGRDLFLRHCSTCHGPVGRGDGPTAVEPRPRDLASGKFSFGTTADAIERTVRGGIEPSMPTFQDDLTGDEITAVVGYVRSLMPQTLEASKEESRVRFGPRPRVVRGYLPPRPGGDAPLTHGLVVGLPNGFVLEYRTDDLRLLGTRRGDPAGAFVDRTDWRGRGGTPLELLGEPLDPTQAGDFGAALELAGVSVELRIELRGVRILGDALQFDGEIYDGDERVGRWKESLRAVQVAGGEGFHRRIEIREPQVSRSFRVTTAGLRVLRVRRQEREVFRGLELWYGGSGDGGRAEVLGVRGPRSLKGSVRGGVGVVLTPVGDRPFTRIDVLRLQLPEFDVDRVAEYAEAFDR